MGTTRSLKNAQKVREFRDAVGGAELVEADMFDGKECFTRGEALRGVEFVFHTAAPLIGGVDKREQEEVVRRYVEATQYLVEEAVKNKVKQVIFMASASNVIGQTPVADNSFVYSDASVFADPKLVDRPNERAKLLAEKVCWNVIRRQPPSEQRTALVSLLPYFMVGPPLFKSLVSANASCQAVTAILNNTQHGFPQVHLPAVDVRDVAAAHVRAMTLDSLRGKSGRYLVASSSLWFSEVIATLREEEKALGKRIRTKIMGPLTLKLANLVNPETRALRPFVNQRIVVDGSQFELEFGVKYRRVDESLREMAH